MNHRFKPWALGFFIGMIFCPLSAAQNARSVKTLYDPADGFEFQYPASYMNDRATSGFRIEQDDSNRGSFLKIAVEFTTSGCQSLGLENASSCRVTQKRQYRNPQGLEIAEIEMVNTCLGECDDFVPARFSVYVANISQNGVKKFIVFEDLIEPAGKETLKRMAQTVTLISPKTL
jgi:hypothetical protein